MGEAAVNSVGVLRVLMVEDDDDFALLIGDALEVKGHSLDRVATGAAAIGRDLTAYDVAVIDWNLPDMNGLELVAGLGRGERIPIVVFTGERSHDVIVEAMRSGAADYLVKAYDEVGSLSHKLQQVVDAHRVRREKERLQIELEDTLASMRAANEELRRKNWELEQMRERLETSVIDNERTVAELREAFETIERMSKLDPLTGVYNRRAFREILHYEYSRAARYGHALSAIMVDVDNFKQINDRFGHLFGDQVLEALAGFLERNMRATDIVARYGGDEFVLLLPYADRARAANVARKLLSDLDRESAQEGTALSGQSFSIGIASYPQTSSRDGEALVSQADMALLRAKRAGKNRFEVWES
ncbi:MAG: diguanylate cyclase [Myxococcales bacterium]|nr:diguanylate cyclase [Myxococcales bacterium]